MKISLLSFLAALAQAQAQNDTQTSFDGCGMDAYYASLGGESTTWDREGLNNLLRATHRRRVAFTNTDEPGVDDIQAALVDLDPGSGISTIYSLYQDTNMAASDYGQRGWIKEHLFPILRGVGILGMDVSDVHNLRPSAVLPDLVRGIKYFGACGVLVRTETCLEPAEGGAADTCSCNRLFTPPANVRGDIARALMYMDLRYDGTDPATLDLRLTDCPFQPERDMAYLSQMLQWHVEDPPDEGEILRNDKACTNWQGNRNPFVDHPTLARQLFGQALPLPAVGERLIYEPCEAIPTLAPTFTPNQCEFYNPGDFQIWLMNSDDPDTVGLYAFSPMPAGFELFMTTNPWNGQERVC
jgi:endonuclease I